MMPSVLLLLLLLPHISLSSFCLYPSLFHLPLTVNLCLSVPPFRGPGSWALLTWQYHTPSIQSCCAASSLAGWALPSLGSWKQGCCTRQVRPVTGQPLQPIEQVFPCCLLCVLACTCKGGSPGCGTAAEAPQRAEVSSRRDCWGLQLHGSCSAV
jgi:hypothetical protein